MARQKGIIKLEGRIGDITFFKTTDGYQARERSGVSAERIKNDPKFELTRMNGLEFGTAGRACKMLRNGFSALLKAVADKRLTSRMLKLMIQVLRMDAVNARGARTVQGGDLTLLTGFDFNVNAPIGNVLKAPFTVTSSLVSGAVGIAVPAFVPKDLLEAPYGATHYRIVLGAISADFATGTIVSDSDISAYLPYDFTASAALSLSCDVGTSAQPMVVAVGVQFCQFTNGVHHIMSNGEFNALSVVRVEV